MRSLPKFLTLYVRCVVMTMAAVTGTLCLLAGAPATFAADLKAEGVISGASLTAGDIFDGLTPEKAAYVLGPAPKPGHNLTLNASTLLRVALALNLPWQPKTSADQIVIRSAATIIGEEEIRHALATPLEEQGVEGNYDISFHKGTAPELVLPQDVPPTFDVVGFRYDPSKDWFQATIMAPSEANPLAQIAIAGKVMRTVQVPVLKTSLRSGDIIGEHDISWVEMYAQDVKPSMIVKQEDLIGMTPRRMAEAGKPVRDIDLERPEMVGRGDAVTIVYQTPFMTLTAKGKSLQGGSKGDIVQLVNLNSNRTLEGTVSGTREITVAE